MVTIVGTTIKSNLRYNLYTVVLIGKLNLDILVETYYINKNSI